LIFKCINQTAADTVLGAVATECLRLRPTWRTRSLQLPVVYRWLLCFLSLLLLTAVTFAQPRIVEAETRRLTFHVSPVPQSGDVAEQVRQGLRNFSASVVKLRAFVVGAENVEPVRQAVEAEFKRRRQSMPLLSIIVIGALPHTNARVMFEAISSAKNTVNPGGLAFVSGQAASVSQSVAEVAPLIEKSLTALGTAHQAIQANPADVLRATCFVTSLADVNNVRQMVSRAYPGAALSFVQLQRTPGRGLVECETVVRLRVSEKAPLRLLNPVGLTASPNYSHIALIGAERVVLSELSLAQGTQEADAVQAFRQLEQALSVGGASIKEVAMSQFYPVSQAASDLIRNMRFNFYDKARPPASTLLLFEGLPGGTAFGVEVIAPKLK
jgi:enamine deaminase RidA (YjgF/YER057c/UK114 family)